MSLVFSDGFETGDFSNWDVTPANASLSVTAGSAYAGTYGCDGDASGAGATAEKTAGSFTTTGGVLHLRCRFNTNDAVYPDTTEEAFLTLSGTTEGTAGQIILYRNGSNYQFWGTSNPDTGDPTPVTSGDVGSGWHSVELVITRAASSGSSDGTAELYVDGVSVGTQSGIDNYDTYNDIDQLLLEITGAGTSGSWYIDNIELYDASVTPIPPPASVSHIWLSTDGAQTFSNIGDSSWTTEVVGGVVVKPGTAYQTIWAMVGSNLWQTTNGGTSWTNKAAVGFECEPDGIDLLDGDIVVITNRASGGNRVALVDNTTVTYSNTGKTTTGGGTAIRKAG